MAMVLTMASLFGGISWIVWVVTTNRRKHQETVSRAQIQEKLLEKLSTNQDLAEFLKTEAGQELMSATARETASPIRRILTSIQAGIVLLALGIAFLGLSRLAALEDGFEGLLVMGTMATALGVGFLLSGVFSYIVSKSWGLLDSLQGGDKH